MAGAAVCPGLSERRRGPFFYPREGSDRRLHRCAVVGVEQGLTLQQHAGDPEQSVGDAAQGTTIGVATRPQGFIAAAACVVDLHGDAGPVEHRLASRTWAAYRMTTIHVLPLRLVTGATPDR